MRVRTVSCIRLGGSQPETEPDEAHCLSQAARAETVETRAVYSGCTYTWQSTPTSEWGGACGSGAHQTRTVQIDCMRSGEGYASKAVDDEFCADAGLGAKPPGIETNPAIYACPPAANLIDGRFEPGADIWKFGAPGELRNNVSQAHTGVGYLQLSNAEAYGINIHMEAVIGRTYELSAWMICYSSNASAWVGINNGGGMKTATTDFSQQPPQWKQVRTQSTALDPVTSIKVGTASGTCFVDDVELRQID